MELHDWLLSCRYIAYKEYKQIVNAQIQNSLSGELEPKSGLFKTHQSTVVDVPKVRKHPIGEVLCRMPDLSELARDVYRRVGASDLEELVLRWYQWHVDNLEPVANYSTGSRFGRNLFRNQVEKKLAAWFLVNARVRVGSVIKDSDTVVLPEGSSAFYVGLAIAAFRKNVSIITSNGPLYCEYLANPLLAAAFQDFHLIGGLADLDRQMHRPEDGGVFGPDSQSGYKHAIRNSPTATVVVMPFSGLLPDDGPFAVGGAVRALKRSIILDSLDEPDNRTRELVFVGDYTKHLEESISEYGSNVFERRQWTEILDKDRHRISLVTVPPPALRAAVAAGKLKYSIRRRLEGDNLPFPLTPVDQHYNTASSKFGQLFQDQGPRLMFHEVSSLQPPPPKSTSAVNQH